MRLERTIYSILILIAVFLAVINWRRAVLFQADNEELRARIEGLESEVATISRVIELARGQSARLRDQNAELMRLRNDITQLQSGTQSTAALAPEN